MRALLRARETALAEGLNITPRDGAEAARLDERAPVRVVVDLDRQALHPDGAGVLFRAFNSTTVNEARFHFGSDYHFDLPATPPTSPAVTIQSPDTGFVFGGNRFQFLRGFEKFFKGFHMRPVATKRRELYPR